MHLEKTVRPEIDKANSPQVRSNVWKKGVYVTISRQFAGLETSGRKSRLEKDALGGSMPSGDQSGNRIAGDVPRAGQGGHLGIGSLSPEKWFHVDEFNPVIILDP